MKPSVVTITFFKCIWWLGFVCPFDRFVSIRSYTHLTPSSRIHPQVVPLQGQNVQIVACHPRSVGQPNCKKYRLDQHLRFQFLSSIASRTAINSRGFKAGPCRILLLWKTAVFPPFSHDFAKLFIICTH